MDYDAIVIGAGNGGLTAAATLARGGQKVLLLERHNIPGGCATSFCRGRFEFEAALHQGVGDHAAQKALPTAARGDDHELPLPPFVAGSVFGTGSLGHQVPKPFFSSFGVTSQISIPRPNRTSAQRSTGRSIRARAAVGMRTRPPPISSAISSEEVGSCPASSRLSEESSCRWTNCRSRPMSPS